MDTIDCDYIALNKKFCLAGVDEVGRGPLAGPVVAATAFFIFDSSLLEKDISDIFEKYKSLGVTDSKKLTAKKRKVLLEKLNIKISKARCDSLLVIEKSEKVSVLFSISEVSPEIIDEINILNASLLAMKNAFMTLNKKISYKLLIDGNQNIKDLPKEGSGFPIVKGDTKSVAIGLASIIAKEYRDNLMEELGREYVGYGLEKHSGYPTKEHKLAIAKLGITPIHRKTFKGVKEFLYK